MSKVAVVTGANSGIGLEACVQLAKLGHSVIMCSRSMEKGEQARLDVLKRANAPPERVTLVQLDLADLENVGSFPERYEAALKGKTPIDMLILNAGVMALNSREETKQGIEAQMGTNVVGHFKFAAVMFGYCKAALNSRIVFVSSGAHKMTKTIDFKDFNRTQNYFKWTVYAETKLGDLLLMAKLNRLLQEKRVTNVIAVGCHPGYSATNLQEHTVFKYLNYVLAQSAEMGAKPTVMAAVGDNIKANSYCGPNGFREMWGEPKVDCDLNSAVFDNEFQDKLWQKCEELTQVNFAAKL